MLVKCHLQQYAQLAFINVLKAKLNLKPLNKFTPVYRNDICNLLDHKLSKTYEGKTHI